MDARRARDEATLAIRQERGRQDKKWGEQNHHMYLWLAILMEEVGEFSQALLHRAFGGEHADDCEKELLQVAAVATAMLECWYRNDGEPK